MNFAHKTDDRKPMKLSDTTIIDDTYAEAFRMRYARIVITAVDRHWVDSAAREVVGYASSIIGCDAEAGIERTLSPDESPDGRPGVEALLFGFSPEAVGKAVMQRTGQCLMTCPTTAVFDGLPDSKDRVPLGKNLRYFGDGFQKSKVIGGQRYWRLPVMDGEFLVSDTTGIEKGVAGGNIIIQGRTPMDALQAAQRAVEVVAEVPGVIAPFPGGVVRSGSKIGSRYKALKASTNDAFCPTLRTRTPKSALHEDATCAYEIVLDGIDEEAVAAGMRAIMEAAAGPAVPMISAGNYGGELGKFHFNLRELLA